VQNGPAAARSLTRLRTQRLLKYKLLPTLRNALEFGAASAAFPAVLESVVRIGSLLTPQEYAEMVVPSVVKLFANPERGVRIALLKVRDQPRRVSHRRRLGN
jgi:hypothetical protein